MQRQIARHRASFTPALILIFLLWISALPTFAQTFTTLYNFTGGSDGRYAYNAVVRDQAGNLYGSTFGGGDNCFPVGCGVVFEINFRGKETALYSFAGADGDNPYSSVIRDEQGNIYGTTNMGGTYAMGTVYKIDTASRETVLHNFAGGTTDGCFPLGGLAMSKRGTLYGTTSNCGLNQNGALFEISKRGKFTLRHRFEGGLSDGAYPAFTSPVLDKDGNIYGVTEYGGAGGVGVVYKMMKKRIIVLHDFARDIDGCYPTGTPIIDGKGNLYGVAGCGPSSDGTVWELSRGGTLTILHAFAGGTSDGCGPEGGMARDSKGSLYGTTVKCGAGGDGTVYELSSDGTFTLLHSFSGLDGSYPFSDLFLDSKGVLYGTAPVGGTYDYGTVWSYKGARQLLNKPGAPRP
jgi:uncharacterized repeat protein (TIGR03803 family)